MQVTITPSYSFVAGSPYISVGSTYDSDKSLRIHQGLRIFNIQTPTTPALVGSCDFADSSENTDICPVIVKDNYVYILGDRELHIVDYKDMSQLNVDCQLFKHRVYDFEMNGNELFIADWGTGYSVYELSNPSAPAFKYQLN